MYKPTKRKAFNFLRSYFDVLNEIKNDTDKLNFLLSIINKQFLNEDPEELNFMVNLCYQSQKHAVETSVKGWLRANKDTPLTDPMTPLGTNPPTNPITDPKEEEEEEKEKEERYKEFVLKSFNYFWEQYPKKVARAKCKAKWLKLKEDEQIQVVKTIKDFVAYKPFEDYTHPNPMTYLNQARWDDVIPKKKKKPVVVPHWNQKD